MKPIRPADLEALLAATHADLFAAGASQDVWSRLQCTCGRAECEIHEPARHTVTLQLDALAAWWRPAGAAPAETRRLAAALTRLGDLLGFWEAGPPPPEPTELLHAVRDRWLAGMGTPLGGPPDDAWLAELALVEARNTLLLEKLLERLAATPLRRLADAGASHARARASRAGAEASAAVRRTLLAWMDDHELLPERTLVREHVLAAVREAAWSPVEARDVAEMAEDASHAVLAFGIADPLWVGAAYGAMEQVAPFAGLRLALVLEDDPVPLPG